MYKLYRPKGNPVASYHVTVENISQAWMTRRGCYNAKTVETAGNVGFTGITVTETAAPVQAQTVAVTCRLPVLAGHACR